MKRRGPDRLLIAHYVFDELMFERRRRRCDRSWRRSLRGDAQANAEHERKHTNTDQRIRSIGKSHVTALFFPERLGYLLTTKTTNVSGLIVRVGRPPGVAGGPSTTSAVGGKIFFVLGSKAMGRPRASAFPPPAPS